MIYDAGFYAGQGDRSRDSAAVVVPLIHEAIQAKSVLDIGCGVGFWAAEFLKHGVEIAHGVDGPWVTRSALPDGSFFEFDFEKEQPPYRLPTLPRYDLITTFEFVEHVDEQFAEPLMDMFCSLADVVVVGGAIPFQGGTHHVNERWPDYWAAKFRARGYEPCDFIRPQVWGLDVEPWYAQNSVAYFKGGAPEKVREIAVNAWGKLVTNPISIVHPSLWEDKSRNSIARPLPIKDRIIATPRHIGGKVKRALLG